MGRNEANRRPAGARVLALLLGLLLTSVGAVALAPAASAHSVLLSSDPADGSAVARVPATVVLTFNEPIQSSTMEVAVTASSGVSVTEVKATVSGTVITQPLPDDLPNDEYTVAYRVISVDGHPVSDTIAFSINDSRSTAEPLGAKDVPYQVGGSTKQAQGETATYAKVLYIALPLFILALLVGVITTRGRYRERNPRDEGDHLANPFVLTRADADREPPKEHIHTRPDITRDRES